VRGDIYFVKLVPRSGSEQTGTRPCIVVSTDAFNEASGWQSITIIPLTSSQRWLVPSPTTVIFEEGEANLSKQSAALAHQITTIDRSKFIGGKVGTLSDEKMKELEQAILNYLNISSG
jgi:mRNA interferase MazF